MNELMELVNLAKEFAPQLTTAHGVPLVGLAVMFLLRLSRTALGQRFLPEVLQWKRLPAWAKLVAPVLLAGLPVLGAGLLAGTAPLSLALAVGGAILTAILGHHGTKAVGQMADQNLVGEPSLARKALAPLFPIDVTKLPKLQVLDGGKK